MKTVYRLSGLCSCGCGEYVSKDTPLYASGSCKMKASRSKDDPLIIEVSNMDKVSDSAELSPGPESPPKLRAPAPTGNPVKDAHNFIAAVKEFKSYSPYRDAPRCKHGSAAALCKHMECRP